MQYQNLLGAFGSTAIQWTAVFTDDDNNNNNN